MSEQVLHTHTHTLGTRVLLISAWAGERPLKVSLKWWMCCSAAASVFNLSHWRNSTASTSNDFLSSAVRDGVADVDPVPLALFHFSCTFFLMPLSAVQMNVKRHPSHLRPEWLCERRQMALFVMSLRTKYFCRWTAEQIAHSDAWVLLFLRAGLTLGVLVSHPIQQYTSIAPHNKNTNNTIYKLTLHARRTRT